MGEVSVCRRIGVSGGRQQLIPLNPTQTVNRGGIVRRGSAGASPCLNPLNPLLHYSGIRYSISWRRPVPRLGWAVPGLTPLNPLNPLNPLTNRDASFTVILEP
jgi:hypothetical protein